MRFAADENFNNDIIRGVLRRYPELDVIRIQDTEVYEADDPVVLEWVAAAGRILLTHDTRTMPDFAYNRVRDDKLLWLAHHVGHPDLIQACSRLVSFGANRRKYRRCSELLYSPQRFSR